MKMKLNQVSMTVFESKTEWFEIHFKNCRSYKNYLFLDTKMCGIYRRESLMMMPHW